MKQITMALMALPVLISSLMISDAHAGNDRFSIGAELASPIGDYGDAANMGFGGSLRYEHPVGYNIDVTGTAGYIMFSGKDSYVGTTFTQVPIHAGAKFYFKEDQAGMYFHLLMGMCVSSSDAVGAETRENFSWAPELGYHLANFDFGLRYQNIPTQNIRNTKWVGLRLAYVFGSK